METDKFTIQKNPQLPLEYKKYFWDCDFNEISVSKYPFFIAERILQFGNSDSIEWLLNVIEIDFLQSVLESSRNLDKKTKNYWELILK